MPRATKVASIGEIRYQNPFLENVIGRIDFSVPIPELGKSIPADIRDIAKTYFPIQEVETVKTQNFIGNQDGDLSRTESQTLQFKFHGLEKEKTLTISESSLAVEYQKYTSYEKVREEFLSLVKKFLEIFPNARAGRLGLRYVNIIKFNKGSPLEWFDYIKPHLLLDVQTYKKSSMIRSFSILELNYSNFNIRYQFGIFNPDYPATVRQRQFVLDLDAYYAGILDLTELIVTLTNFILKSKSYLKIVLQKIFVRK